ncbi:ATPase family associated with various cellular activities (AAA) domain-containing protein [Hirsutella rhossiliensis]|uniref:ATPase family associated with various cellular activities (AAA) domain-containing protein n=1 Tax=Hirsutella rhossiliensis TaxID=111463 RepID=A0A9P8MT57_9HYPO|nr:ATPase family associated with various cellular activities (AAA) domain-containing protein [Hirsutella rhossiliensis]KAH0959954.1 ATPase family associated with various cellular activities (AAA) domain-containing protein [Hirsutella rhossiliensis]
MEPHDVTAGPSDRRKDTGSLQTPVEETPRLKAETGPTKSNDPESVEASQIESKKRATRQEAPARKPTKAARSRNHLRAKSKHEDREESSSDSDSDSTDSDPFTERDAPKSKKSSRSSKARAPSRKSKAKPKSSLSAKAKRQTRNSSDSDSDSSDSTTSTDAHGDNRKGPGGKDAAKGDIYHHIDRIPAGIGLPGGHLGNLLPSAHNGNLSNQPASFVTPPSKRLGRLGLGPRAARGFRGAPSAPRLDLQEPDTSSDNKKPRGSSKKATRKRTKVDFKRVDWVWDSSLYTYRLQDTAEMSMSSLYDDYIFHVRRTFDCEGKYRATFVDVRSKLLRECLQDVIGNVRGASLVDETPKLDPNLLFLYLEDFRTHLKHLKKARPAGDNKKERKKNRTRLENKRKQLKVLIKYLDKDYAKVKESLYPMLDSGVITFDLLWALWKPNTLIYGTTYGAVEDPRVFKVDMAYHQSTIMRGDFYFIEGKYLEFDGKKFGYGTVAEEISDFQGARKITSLPCYPLRYHKEQDQVQKDLIARGKKFVALNGVHYKCYSGIAYMKRKKGSIIKFNVQQSRVMVDPAIFRRINPNYSVSTVRPKDHDILSDEGSGDESGCCECESDGSEQREKVEYVSKVFKNEKGDVFVAKIPKHETEAGTEETILQSLPGKAVPREGKSSSGSSMVGGDAAETPAETAAEVLPEFSEEDYLIASPVVFGFSFSEKQWLELSVSAVEDITWNEKAWESLVLEPETKDLIQALVQSRKYHPTQTIDDVIQGKGKGLVTVLHGPPGTGKTLTAEGISELLKCPLYMASAGELGTDSRYLEAELQKILDICHAWGAILLLDEADVFLEKRNMQDIHRNALVSIFLRQLEYFQGILFLTTNRVETFDEAFQSRIHIALRYDALDAKAKKTIFKMFIDRIKAFGKLELQPFSEDDLEDLARHDLNGREIKNVVGSAQDLAVSKGESFSMRHIRQVLDVHAKFGRDLRGGAGYEDAMRSYF